jgi:hypothetical protein
VGGWWVNPSIAYISLGPYSLGAKFQHSTEARYSRGANGCFFDLNRKMV